MAIKPLSNFDILKIVKKLKINNNNFRGVFMKDELPSNVHKVECGIINLEDSDEEGSHWKLIIKTININIILTLMGMLNHQKNSLDI